MAKKRYVLVGTGGRAISFIEPLVTRFRDHGELVALCDLSATRLAHYNSLLAGRLDTERTKVLDRLDAEARGVDAEAIAAESQAEVPIGRYGTADEFGAVAAFLASDLASYVTGAAIPIDGGLARAIL